MSGSLNFGIRISGRQASDTFPAWQPVRLWVEVEMSDEPYRIEFTSHPNYLHVYVAGKEDSVEISRQYWTEAVAEAKRLGLKRLLVEEDIEVDAPATAHFEFAKELQEIAGTDIVIAFVDRHAQHDPLNRFAEVVATNRGIKATVFNTTDDAAAWLTGT